MKTKLTIKQMPVVEVVNKDLIVEINDEENGKVGELHISKGSVDYYPKGAQKKHYRFYWDELTALFEEKGKERK